MFMAVSPLLGKMGVLKTEFAVLADESVCFNRDQQWIINEDTMRVGCNLNQ